MLFYVRDRRSTAAPKKLLDIVSGETVVSNTTRNKELPVYFPGSNGAFQNRQMERSLDASKCASSIIRTHPVSSHCQSTSTVMASLKQPVTKEASGLQSNDQLATEVKQKSTLLGETSLQSSDLVAPDVKQKSALLGEPGLQSNDQVAPEVKQKSAVLGEPGLQSNDQVAAEVKQKSIVLGEPIVPTSMTGISRTKLESEHHTDDRHTQGSGKDSNIMVSQQNGCNQPENSSSKKLSTENGIHEVVLSLLPFLEPCDL